MIFKKLKEPFCGISHAAGVLLSLFGLIALLFLANGQPTHLIAFGIYGISLMTLYAASSLYHSLRVSPETENRLARFDYCAIYFLIAGTYTPVCLIALSGVLGWSVLGVVWGIGIVGMLCSALWKNKPDWLRYVLYISMGWMIVVAMTPLRAALPPAAITWLFAGGAAYMIGAIILAIDRPHLWPGKFSAHDLWHIFVLAGSICHFVMIAWWVAPLPVYSRPAPSTSASLAPQINHNGT